jgi:hypothetical protein
MAMRIVKNHAQTTLAEELKLLKAFEEEAPVVINIDIYRSIRGDATNTTYSFYSTWSITRDGKQIEYCEDNFSYFYHGQEFRKLMKREIGYLRNYLKYLRRKYRNIELVITRSPVCVSA